MNTQMRHSLTELARMRGVRAAILTMESDGLTAAGVSELGVSEDALAAFATALLRRARLACEAAGYGPLHFLALDAERGRLFVAARGDMAVVVLSEADANTGLIRMAIQRALSVMSDSLDGSTGRSSPLPAG